MSQNEDHFKLLVNLIREVRPSLADTPISMDDSLVENLGLDSLDVMQLTRKVRRVVGSSFDLQAWAAYHPIHKYAIRSLVDAMGGQSASGSRPNPADYEAQQDAAR